jgi:hypothetical protein
MNNVINKNIETLGSDNFQHWAFGMEKWLDAIGVWELTFDRPRPPHPGDLPELLVFERNEAIGQDDDENEAIAANNIVSIRNVDAAVPFTRRCLA